MPAEVTRAVLAQEFPPARAWGEANGWQVTHDESCLALTAKGKHPATGGPVTLTAAVDSYRAVPPAWQFIDAASGVATPAATPNRGTRNGQMSIIYGVGVICAHFSRTAYATHSTPGPHAEWQLAEWADTQGGPRATTLAQMLAVIDDHLHWSDGWLA